MCTQAARLLAAPRQLLALPEHPPPFRAAARALTLRKPLGKGMPVPNQDPAGVRRGQLWEQLGLRDAPRLCRAGAVWRQAAAARGPPTALSAAEARYRAAPELSARAEGRRPPGARRLQQRPRRLPLPRERPAPLPPGSGRRTPCREPPGAVSQAGQSLTELRRRGARGAPARLRVWGAGVFRRRGCPEGAPGGEEGPRWGQHALHGQRTVGEPLAFGANQPWVCRDPWLWPWFSHAFTGRGAVFLNC